MVIGAESPHIPATKQPNRRLGCGDDVGDAAMGMCEDAEILTIMRIGFDCTSA